MVPVPDMADLAEPPRRAPVLPNAALADAVLPTTGRLNAGRLRAGCVIGALLALAGVFVAVRLSLPTDGTETRAANPLPDGEDVQVVGGPSGLRAGDVVLAIEGRPIVDRVPAGAQVGDHLTYQVRRGGQVLALDVAVRGSRLGPALRAHWASVLLVGWVLALGVYVLVKRPDDPAARMLAIVGALLTCAATYWVLPLHALDLAGGAGWWANLGGAAFYTLAWPAMLHFALVFPRPNSFVLRHPAALAVPYLIPVVAYLARAVQVRADAATPLHQAAAFVPSTSFVEYLFPVLVIGAFLTAYRRADDESTRTRMRLVAGSFAVSSLVYLALWKLPTLLVGHAWGPEPFHFLLFLACPMAISVAVLRVQLFDIDVVVRRSLVYACLTTSVTAIYIVASGVLGRVFGQRHDWVALAATGLVAVLFAPVHRRARRGISRVLYGDRDDPYAIVARLGKRLESAPPTGDVLPGLVKTVAEALRLPYVAVELVSADGFETAARQGQLAGTPLVLPLTHHRELTGRLVVGERAPGEGFGRRDRAVLDGLASQVGMAVHAARLTLELQRSRQRLVAAREEERKRLRRDLHDGVGPVLAATALQVQTARRLVGTDPGTAKSILGELSVQIREAIGDVRNIVHDLRPASLDQLGLTAAVWEQAQRFSTDASAQPGALNVVVDAKGDLRYLPAAVEVAAFRIVCEALNNAHRHGVARNCRISLLRNHALEIEVTDDGKGLPPTYRCGVGLQSMRERAEELGGTFTIDPLPSGGTRVLAQLPLPAPLPAAAPLPAPVQVHGVPAP